LLQNNALGKSELTQSRVKR